MIAVSLAVAHAAAAAAGVPLWKHLAGDRPPRLPLPEIQLFGGGAHAAHRVDIQDFMVIPVGAATFAEALDMTAEVYRAAGALLADRQARRRRRRGRLLAGLRHQRGGAGACRRRHRAGRLRARQGPGDLPRRRRVRFRQGRPLSPCPRAARARQRRHDRHAPRLARPLSDRLDRGSARRGRRSRPDRLHQGGRPAACRSSATTISSPMPPASPARKPPGPAIRR